VEGSTPGTDNRSSLLELASGRIWIREGRSSSFVFVVGITGGNN
jgi:hypothetical protein